MLNCENILNLQQNTVCSIKKIPKLWKFYTKPSLNGLWHVASLYSWHRTENAKRKSRIFRIIVHRHGVAGAVLQTPLSHSIIIKSLTHGSFVEISSKHCIS